MQSHDYTGEDGRGVYEQPAADSQVELDTFNNRGYPYPRQYRSNQYQQQQQQPSPYQQNPYQQQTQQDGARYSPPYPGQESSLLTPSNLPMNSMADLSRPLASPRNPPVYQSAHTSTTAVNSTEDYINSPAWAQHLQHGNGGFLTESHNTYGSWSGTSSPRNSGRGSTVDLAYLKNHRHASSLDSRPVTPSFQHSSLTLTGLLPQAPEEQLSKDWVVPGTIAKVHKRDDAETWKGWRRFFYRFTPLLTILNMVLYLAYLGLRIFCIIEAQQKFNSIYAAAWLFVAVEVATAIPSIMHNNWTVMSARKRNRPKLRLLGEDVPTVDVFITCCKEDDDVVLDTVRGACDLDYPRDRFRVIVLDDGKVDSLRKAVEALSSTAYPNLYYIARPKYPGVPHHFKAGNLNYGLEAVESFPGGRGEYMAALDADMIPERQLLRAIVPHLVADPKMALACPPQLFYNTPAADPLAQSLDFFVHVIEPIKDTMGVAWCTGSGYVARRTALDEIGNFPLGSLAEDVATSTKMLGKGWKTAFIHEPLQFGTVPDDFGSHLKQRTRWAIGTVDTSFKLNFCLWGDSVRKMSFAQRFSGFLYATLSLYTILLTISLFAIPIILIMGKQLVAYADETQLRWLVRACFATTICNRLCEFLLYIPAGYHTGRRGSRYQMWMSPYIALCLVRAFILPKWLGGQAQAFTPTGSISSKLNERDAHTRKGMARRIFSILFQYMGWFHLAFVYVTLVGVTMSTYRCFYEYTGVKDILQGLVTHAFWPPLTFLFLVSSMYTPVAYAVHPPTMPDREELLVRDPKTGVAHPSDRAKTIAFSGQTAYYELEYTGATIYTALIFVMSFLPFLF